MQSTTIWHRRRVAGVPLGELLAVLAIVATMTVIVYSAFRGHPLRSPTLAEQRQQVYQRVQAIGGWTVLRAQTDSLLQIHKRDYSWYPYAPSPSPGLLVSLQPRQVLIRPFYPAKRPRMVEINFWSGSRRETYYALWVLPHTAPPGYQPT